VTKEEASFPRSSIIDAVLISYIQVNILRCVIIWVKKLRRTPWHKELRSGSNRKDGLVNLNLDLTRHDDKDLQSKDISQGIKPMT
jgi:hypothetical protein